jgi:effector-binding domain-containing protein
MYLPDISLKDTPSTKIAYLKCRGPWRQLPEMLAKLSEHLAKNELIPAGSAFGIYYNTPKEASPQELRWEVGYPVASGTPESPEDRAGFGIRSRPGGRMATIIHRGLYRQAGASYARLEAWIGQQRLKVCGPAEEIYLSSEISPGAEQEVEIRLPVCPL